MPADQSGWAVQVSAVRDRAEADAMARQLVTKGYQAYVLAPGFHRLADVQGPDRPFQDEAGRRENGRAREEGREVQTVDHAVAPPRGASEAPRAAAAPPLVLALASGVLLALSFPRYGWPLSCLGRARAPACGTSRVARSASGSRVRARTGDRRGVLRGHRGLDQRRHGTVRRTAPFGRRRHRWAPRRVPGAVSRAVCGRARVCC